MHEHMLDDVFLLGQVEDISISRCHAKISFRDGRFVLEDNRSRFGTLVCMREPFALPADQTVSIQSGSPGPRSSQEWGKGI